MARLVEHDSGYEIVEHDGDQWVRETLSGLVALTCYRLRFTAPGVGPSPARQFTMKEPQVTTTRDDTFRISPRNLRVLRQLRGLSQAQLSRQSGVGQGHISELERGAKQARPATIHKLAGVLDVPMPILLDNQPDGMKEMLQHISIDSMGTKTPAATRTDAVTR